MNGFGVLMAFLRSHVLDLFSSVNIFNVALISMCSGVVASELVLIVTRVE